jgi:hypothetical protein
MRMLKARSTGLLALLLAWLPGCGDDDDKPQAPGLKAGQVLFSELMYHPVDEGNPQEVHEFIEIHNPGNLGVDLSGTRVGGGVRFTFPAGTTLGPGQYLVVAKNRAALLGLADYRLDPARVLGDYDGELDNDGERIVLESTGGALIDEVNYNDGFPWPLGADALGAGPSWLPASKLGGRPIEEHRYRGRSLERVSFTLPGTAVANWVASELGAPSPGRANGAQGTPAAVVLRQEVVVDAAGAAVVKVTFSSEGTPIAEPQIEYFADDVEKVGEATQKLALTRAPAAGASDWQAALPALPRNSVVRYRIVGQGPGTAAGSQAVSPRASDPNDWHAYFVAPEIAGKTKPFHIFISKANWELMWDHIERGRVPGHVSTLGGKPDLCRANEYWNERVPAVLVIDGQVYDVQARYQGSGVNRAGGRFIPPNAWPMDAVKPSRPANFQALSWHINFPRYNRHEKKRTFNLSKLTQGCTGFNSTVGATLFEQAGVPAARQNQYARVYINGVYYHYMQRLEHMDEQLLERYYGKDHQVGDLWKAVGTRWDQGPYGWSDERPLEDHCGFTAAQRYDTSYKRETLTDYRQGAAEVKQMIEDLHRARAAGVPAMRKFFQDNFDLPALTSYMAVKNWLSPWDDFFHNHFIYRKVDGKFMLLPTDFDGEFGLEGGNSHPDQSFFAGMENDRSNRNNWMNYLKDAYLRAFRPEFLARLQELSLDVLHPSNVRKLIDEVAATYELAEAKQAPHMAAMPMGMVCGGFESPQYIQAMKAFAGRRHERVQDGLFD